MMNPAKPTVLFIEKPSPGSKILKSDAFNDSLNQLYYDLTTKEAFLEYLRVHASDNIQAIYGGYPQFSPIGGLNRELVNDPRFPSQQLKCIAVCSRGYNGIDSDVLRENNIKLYNYQDSKLTGNYKENQVGNDVADCVLWHILEGFRKFSFQQTQLKIDGDTFTARAHLAGKQGEYTFGNRLTNGSHSLDVRSPRGHKCLILGLGSIGKQIGLKLQHGLGMQIHYSKRSEDTEITQAYGWKYHLLGPSLYNELRQFKAIVIALPGTQETFHLINSNFLSYCDSPNLTLVNIGRGFIVDMHDIEIELKNGNLRHFGTDVFESEPVVEDVLRSKDFCTTITPHIASSTSDVFDQSCELALSIIMNVCLSENDSPDDDSIFRIV